LAPFRPNGKPLHVHGLLGPFERVAAKNAAMLRELADTGVELVGLDPSMTLTYRAEYAGALDAARLPRVLLVQEWLGKHLDALPVVEAPAKYRLLPHCTERTTAPAATREWTTVFAKCGLSLEILPSGCCGMAGTYGHEAEHRATSEAIYSLSWAQHVAEAGRSGKLLATGYSCRSQAAHIDGIRLPHPLQALLRCVTRSTAPEPMASLQEVPS
jgi:Fe-S oxidoreductase